MNSLIDPIILAVIFVIHNWEEWVSFDRMPKWRFTKTIWNRQSFHFAAIVLSFLVLVFSLPYFQKTHTLILCSLSLNAFQHGFLSLWYRRVTPGTLSALFLMFPFCLIYFTRLFREGEMNFYILIASVILSPIVTIFAIWTTLWLGNLLFSNKQKRN